MPLTWLLLLLAVLGAVFFVTARSRAIASVDGDARRLHSLPTYYGLNGLLTALVPALLLLAGWLVIQPMLLERSVAANFPQEAIPEGSTIGLVMSDVRRVADSLDNMEAQAGIDTRSLDQMGADIAAGGTALGAALSDELIAAAQEYRAARATFNVIMAVAVIA
ncbi:MAG: phosphate ABC transporter permease family protein, partial [Pseudomonadota bacterium]